MYIVHVCLKIAITINTQHRFMQIKQENRNAMLEFINLWVMGYELWAACEMNEWCYL